jgi:hypothetical protein
MIENDKYRGKCIVGFSIFISDPNENTAEISARKKAKNLSDFISVAYGVYIGSYLHGREEIPLNGTVRKIGVQINFGVGRRRVYPLNFDLKEKMPTIIKDANINENIGRGLKVFEDGDNGAIIIELFQVLEARNLTDLKERFEPLRDVLSHGSQIRQDTRKRLEDNFGLNYFDFNSNGTFDYASTHNLQRLRNEAIYLLNEVIRHVRQD